MPIKSGFWGDILFSPKKYAKGGLAFSNSTIKVFLSGLSPFTLTPLAEKFIGINLQQHNK
jgi:hypothetical protein